MDDETVEPSPQRGGKTGILENQLEEMNRARAEDAKRDHDATEARELRNFRLLIFSMLINLVLTTGIAGVGFTGTIPFVGEIGITQAPAEAPAPE